MKHTNTPWESFNHYVWTKDKTNIASCKVIQEGNPITPEESYANAEFIVRAVNNHERLLEACKRALETLERYNCHYAAERMLKAAIKQAEDK